MAEKTAALATVPAPKLDAIEPQPQRLPCFSLAPRNFEEAVRFAKMLADSDLAPKDFKGKPANVMIALQMGSEVGLSPMAAIQNIAVINGRPSIWGDSALALVIAHRDYENHKEYYQGNGDDKIAIMELKRKGHDTHVVKFSVADAKKARLWGKEGPWSNFPDRMLQQRARGFALRDKFADALRGLNIREEVEDFQIIEAAALGLVQVPQVDPARSALKNEINTLLTSVGMNEANRTALICANEADLSGCLESLKTIKFVLTEQRIPVQQWPALLQKQSRNLANYAAELKTKHEAKNGTGAQAQETAQAQTESAAPSPEQQPAAAERTGATNGSGDSRPAAGQDPLFVSEEETKPAPKPKPQPAVAGRFRF